MENRVIIKPSIQTKEMILEKERVLREVSERFQKQFEQINIAIRPFLLEQARMRTKIAEMLAPTLEMMERLKEVTKPIIEQALRFQEFKESMELTIEPRGHSFTMSPEIISPSISLSAEDRNAIADEVCRRLQKGNVQNRKSYILPSNAVWEKLRMKFFDGHILKVKYPGMKIATFDYKDMGFIDNKSQKPDVKWEFLRAIAENGGALTVGKFDKRFNRNVKYETNKRLKEFFGMAIDAFPRYRKKDGYRADFTILPEQSITPLFDGD